MSMEDAKQSMELTVGAVLEGKVKSITNFGAFIALPENKTGMVHISEIANTYVSDIRQHLTEGQDVKVVVINTDPAGKINLSIKRLEPRQPREGAQQRTDRGERSGGFRKDQNQNGGQNNNTRSQPSRPGMQRSAAPVPPPAPKSADQLFEERLKAFMSESDTKLSSMRADHRTKSRRR